MPKVSVYMPVYNTKEEWLRAAIESILNQTFTDFEFIIINDGSTNNAKQVIFSYNDRRIRYIEQENQGFIAASNKGLELAQGEYIAKMDADDISLSERLEKQVKYLDNNHDIGLVGAGFKIFDKKDLSIIHPPKIGFLNLLQGCCTTVFMLRKSIVEQYNLRFRKEYIHAEDYDFYARFLRYANIENIQEILYLYRWHGDNASATKADIQAENSQKIRENILNLLAPENNVLKKQIIEMVIPQSKRKYKFVENIFSLKNSDDKRHKVITMFGIKIKIKRKAKNHA